MITQKELAQRLGLSVSTVSRALAGSTKLPPETVERVQGLAAQVGYRRYRPASALRTRRTGVIGLAVGDIGNPYFASLAHHIEREVDKVGLSLLIANSQEDPTAQEKVIGSMLAQGVDGLLLVPTGEASPLTIRLINQVPTVAVDRVLDGTELDCALVDSALAVVQLAAHLAQNGYFRPAILCGPADTSTGISRAEAVAAALRRHFPDVPIPTGHVPHNPNLARAACAKLLSNNDVDALVVGGNMIALGALQCLQETRAQIGLATFDDLPWFSYLRPSLTAIAADPAALARAATTLLRRRIDSPSASPKTIFQPATLRLRDSTTRLCQE